MSVTRATGRGAAASEEHPEFMEHLYKGGELLAAGSLEEARGHLEKAFALHPKNEKCQNLLGLTCFKLGIFDRAAEVYELLVRENPVDPTLRVNLGLVYLKNNASARAIREFETAVDLQPTHVKAQNYLGLALAQAGDFARAREHFVAAGSEAMAEKMTRALAEAAAPPPAEPPAPVPPSVPKQRVAEAAPVPAEPPPGEEAFPPELQEEASFPQDVASETSFGDLDHESAGQEAYGSEGFEGAPADEAMAESFDAHQAMPESVEPQRFAPLVESLPGVQESYGDPEAAGYEGSVGGEEGSGVPLTSDWGAQFGFDLANAPPPADPFRAPDDEGRPFVPPEVQGGVGEDLRFAEDEGPGANAPAEALRLRVEAPKVDVALEVAAISAPGEESAAAGEPILLSEAMAEEDSAQDTSNRRSRRVPDFEPRPAPGASSSLEAAGSDWMSERPAAHLRSPPGVKPAPTSSAGHSTARDAARASPEPTPSLVEAAQAGRLHAPQAEGPFAFDDGVVVLSIRDELVTRCEGLLAFQGALSVKPEYRRFRGRPTEQAMGLPGRPMSRVSGQGTMVLETGKSHFRALRLEDVAAYFREEVLFAFEEALTFENGRLTSDFAAEVDLVHLSGEGQVLLKLPGALRSLEVRADAPITVPLSRWVGWYGNLVPAVVALPFTLEGMEAGVELSGEGHVLLAVEPTDA